MQLDLRIDNRGWFKENWQQAKIAALPGAPHALREFQPVQNNVSLSTQAGVTRGLHAEPWNKFISIAQGEIFAAWCDLRADSPTFGQVFSTPITPGQAVFVPRGVANGFQALEPTVYTYLLDAHWSPNAQYSHVNLADPALGIAWPISLSQAELSASDKTHPLLVDVTPVAPKKILIIGAQGQIGQALATEFPTATLCSHAEFDLTADYEALEAAFDWDDYAVIINAAAYTAVDQAEADRAQCWAVNAEGPTKLARLATKHRLMLVHFSSDYVFDGQAAIASETDSVAPLNFYGASKAAGDAAVSAVAKHYIVRTSWVVGSGKNFVRTMLQLATQTEVNPQVVNDQVGRLAFSDDVAAAVAYLINGEHPYGTYNVTSDGQPQSWADIARQVFELAGADPARVVECSTAEYVAGLSDPVVPRPQNSQLSLAKIKAAGFAPTDGEARLRTYVADELHG